MPWKFIQKRRQQDVKDGINFHSAVPLSSIVFNCFKSNHVEEQASDPSLSASEAGMTALSMPSEMLRWSNLFSLHQPSVILLH